MIKHILKFTITGTIVIFLMGQLDSSASADVSRAQMKAKIAEETTRDILLTLSQGAAEREKPVILARCTDLASLLDNLPADSYGDDVADWIVNSTVEQIDFYAAGLAGSDDLAKPAKDETSRVITPRLKTLTPERGKQLLESEKHYLESEKAYRPLFNQYLINSIKDANRFEFNLSGFSDISPCGLSLKNVLRGLVSVSRSGPLNSRGPLGAKIDVSNDQLISEILCMTFAYGVRSELQNSAAAGRFAGNLYAPIYSEGSTASKNPYSFDQIKTSIGSLMPDFAQNDGHVCKLDGIGLLNLLIDSDYLRYGVATPPRGDAPKDPLANISQSITFKNDPKVWSTVLSDVNGP